MKNEYENPAEIWHHKLSHSRLKIGQIPRC
jgi:hypothetical protein